MNVTLSPGLVRVTLSRRNLKSLLAKLDKPSMRTLCRRCENGVGLIVVAEDDDRHYLDRDPGPTVEDREDRDDS